MGFPWRQILGVAKTVGNIFLPGVVMDAVDRIEDTVITMKAEGKAGWTGAEKQQQALGLILDGIVVAEGIAKKDLIHDPAIAQAGARAIDAAVAAQKAVAELQYVVALVKAARVPETEATD